LLDSTIAATWWDAVQYGQKGFAAGQGNALDLVDLGPTVDALFNAPTRWGVTIPIHFGNIWNSLVTASPTSRVKLVALPNFIIAPQFMIPDGKPMNKWTWYNDFFVTIAYRIGGS
jgi:hypothetical protein